MADIKSCEERSRNMSAIHSKDTKPEIFVRKRLFALGFRYRIGPKYIPGHPDIYLSRYHAAVFVHGCFWHRHPGCKLAYMPKSREDFWARKFADNVHRDEIVREQLWEAGIRQLVVWECAIREVQKKRNSDEQFFALLREFILSDQQYEELCSCSLSEM